MRVSLTGSLPNRVMTAAVGLVVFALVASACGSPAALKFPDVPEGAAIVDQDGLKFRPGDLSVTAGDTVYFTNSEFAIHTVTVDGENVSGDMKRGDAFVWTFDRPGEYRVSCDYHPKMRATITVE
jgi:plastocyanin